MRAAHGHDSAVGERRARVRQVCALVGDEGDATPFTREVTVEKVSTKLHENGYQRRGNEALSRPPLSVPAAACLSLTIPHSPLAPRH